MVLQGDEVQLEARFGPFGNSANLDVRLVHGLRRTYHRLGNHFGCNRWYSYVGQVETRSGPFGDSVNHDAR